VECKVKPLQLFACMFCINLLHDEADILNLSPFLMSPDSIPTGETLQRPRQDRPFQIRLITGAHPEMNSKGQVS